MTEKEMLAKALDSALEKQRDGRTFEAFSELLSVVAYLAGVQSDGETFWVEDESNDSSERCSGSDE